MAGTDHKIYLASKSPRRRELLRQIGLEFEMLVLREGSGRDAAVSEVAYEAEAPENYVVRIAREKAQSGWNAVLARRLFPRPVLAADTTVTIDGRILGKPANTEEAMHMLQALSGRTHQVMTAVAVIKDDNLDEIMHCSEVRFTLINDASMRAYCALHEPYDKAGSYAVQGYAAQFIEHISGSYSGIMGLPLFETTQLLKRAGIKLL